jgi:pyruvate/2-oxoglutarate dehydrogenase complex dihydrolipoamide acyltransferase (E2) component
MEDWAQALTDVTPARPELREYTEPARRGRRAVEKPAEPEPSNEAAKSNTPADPGSDAPPDPAGEDKPYFYSDIYGEVHEFADYDEAVASFAEYFATARGDERAIAAIWQNGARLVAALREHQHEAAAELLHQQHAELLAALAAAADPPIPGEAGATTPQQELPMSQEYPVLVPATTDSREWFQIARNKLREMHTAQRPGSDFRRFREVNAVPLAALRQELRSWAAKLDTDLLTAGEAERWVT